MQLTAITVLPGTVAGGAVSFIGLQAGSQVTISTAAADASGLLGWWHYSQTDINTDILAKMAIPNTGSSGFSAPLAAGSYSFWIQDFNTGPLSYGFDLVVSQTPEPSTYATILGALSVVAIGLLVRRLRYSPEC